MNKPTSINDLLNLVGTRLTALKTRSVERNLALDQVRAALPPKLAEVVISAGIEHGRLTIGVAGAPWAARLRYTTESLRTQVGTAMGMTIASVRIKVVPPRPHDDEQ